MKKLAKIITIAAILIIATPCVTNYLGITKFNSHFPFIHKKYTRVVRIEGGLGSQLCGIAFALYLKDKTRDNVVLDTETHFKEDQNGKPKISEFLEEKQSSSCFREKCIQYFNVSLEQLSLEIARRVKGKVKNILANKEKTIKWLTNDENQYIIGNFFCMFAQIRPTLLKEFCLKVPLDDKNKEMLKKIKDCNSVSVNVRRTDYRSFGGDLDLSYQEKAIEYIVSKTKDPHFFIFSDDIEWCKKNMKISYPHTFVDINDDSKNYFDFELIRNCKHNIIANSTFSWWAAFLNENPNKIVVTPTGYAGELEHCKNVKEFSGYETHWP